MSLFGLFNIGSSALYASQTALSVTSNNIANADTPGYSKQDVILDVSTPLPFRNGTIGTGVSVAGIRRSYDQFIQSQLLGQTQSKGASDAMNQTLSQIEQVFNESSGSGLATPLSDFFNAWQDVANSPDTQTPRTVLLQKANALVSAAQQTENSITGAIKAANDGIGDAVRQVNSLASNIASLNEQITQIEAGSSSSGGAAGLRDQRDQLMSQLGSLVQFSSYEDQTGAVAITVGMRTLVSGTTANTMSAPVGANGDRSVVLDGIDVTGTVQQGKIGGLIAARTDLENQVLTPLRRMMASVTQQVNNLHQQGFGLDGSTGNNFFTPLQLSLSNHSAGATATATITNQSLLTLDEYRIGFDGAGNYQVTNAASGAVVSTAAYNPLGTTITLPGMSISISGAVTKADSLFVSPLTTAVSNLGVNITDPQQVAASDSAAGLPGDNVNALAIAGLTQSAQANLGGATFTDFYNGLVSTTGALSQTASDSATFNTNLLNQIQNQRDSISGVSLDEEAANLLRFQRSYEAGAKIINVADELIQAVLNL